MIIYYTILGHRIGSAINQRDTFTILTQEGIRMLRNNHSDLTKEIREKVMDKFATKIQNSRYDENDRRAIILSALNGYLKQVEQDQAAIQTFCRPRDRNRARAKLMVPCSPN